MSNKMHDVTPKALLEFHRNLLRELSMNYGGDTTINELRVLNQIIYCGIEGRTCSVTALHKVTGIPMPTVSRAVTNLQNGGWLCETRDPDDGRKRVITLSPRSRKQTIGEIDGKVQWVNEFRQRGLPA